MSNGEDSDTNDSDAGVEVPEAPAAGTLDPDDFEPDEPAIAEAERAAAELGPEVPTSPEPGAGDTTVVGLFWKLALVFNVAVFGVSVGPMIGFFLDDWDLALQVFAVGALAAAYGFVRYYRFRRDRDGESDESNTV